MACLLQQFKCPSELYIRLHSPQSSTSLKSRQPVCFRMQCVLPMASTMTKATATIEMEKLQLPSFDSHIDSVAIERTLFHKEVIGPFLKENLESTFAKETKFIDGEAAVAAADAIALAKEAAQVAKEVALMFGNKPLDESDSKKLDLPFNVHINRPGGANFSNIDAVDTLSVHYLGIQTEVEEKHSMEFPTKGSDTLDPLDDDELKLLQVQLSSSVAVRSERQKERRARRKRAGEKVSSTTISASNGASSRKKRISTQNVDYNDPLRHLRGTTSTSKLLTATEELELSNGIQDFLKLETLHEELAEKCGCEPTLAQWAAAAGVDRKTLRKRLNYGTLCKDKMINSNIRLVISIAKNYQGAGMSLQDLVQEGCRGLVRGAEKFDASKGFKFSTYAHWWIKQAVRKSLSDQSRIIRLPFHMVDATYKVKEARKQLFNENGRHPNDKEVAEATGLTMKRLNAVMLTPKAPRSLDQKIGIDQNLKPSDIISDPDAETTEDILRKRFMKQDLEKVLASLSSRETQVVRWRFGMEDGRMKTLQEIGELMGITRERVRQIESNAFRKLKNKKRIKNLHQYQFSQA